MVSLYLGWALVGFLTLLGVATPIEEKDGDLLLYMNEYDFYSQKVMLVMYEKGLEFVTRSIDVVNEENYETWFLKFNERGDLPVLVVVNVNIISDPTRIIDYLEENYPPTSDSPERKSLTPSNNELLLLMKSYRDRIDAIDGYKLLFGTFYFPNLVKSPRFPYFTTLMSYFKASFEIRPHQLSNISLKNTPFRDPLLAKAEESRKTKTDVRSYSNFVGGLLNTVQGLLADVETQLANQKDVSLTNLLERLDVIGLSHRFWGNGTNVKVEAYFKRVKERPSYMAVVPGTWIHMYTLYTQMVTGLQTVAKELSYYYE